MGAVDGAAVDGGDAPVDYGDHATRLKDVGTAKMSNSRTMAVNMCFELVVEEVQQLIGNGLPVQASVSNEKMK